MLRGLRQCDLFPALCTTGISFPLKAHRDSSTSRVNSSQTAHYFDLNIIHETLRRYP
jgi:hypothetical protein